MSTTPSAAPLRVAYLVSQYPAISHTFIDQEIAGLRARGAEIHTFSIRPCPEKELLTEHMRAEAAATPTLRGGDMTRYAKAHGDALSGTPGAWFRLAARAVRSGELTPKARVWQGFYFAEAVLLYRMLKERDLRHIHVHFPNVSADVARLVVAMGRDIDGPDAGWRWTMTIHGPTEFDSVDRHDLAAKVASADGVTCISSYTRSQVLRFTNPEHWDKVVVNRLGIDVSRYTPPTTPRADHGGPLKTLTVARLVAEKGLPILIDALARLRNEGIPIDAQVVGTGELRESLERRSANVGARVVFRGAIGQDKLPDIYREVDAFVLPSFQEGLPIVIMEAMATELPVVVTRIAGISELVQDGENGFVVPPSDTDALVAAVRRLAEDPELRARLGAAARRTVCDLHDRDQVVVGMENFLRGRGRSSRVDWTTAADG